MKTYRVEDILTSFGIFLGEEVEALNEIDAKDQILIDMMDNLGNYIDIELEEVEEEEGDE